MTALILDAGALIAVDRNDRTQLARLHAARREGIELRTNPNALAQAWRDGARQAQLSRLLPALDIAPMSEEHGRKVGELLRRSRTADVVDASIVLLAHPGDVILTSDPDDIAHLANFTRRRVRVTAC